MRSTPSPVFRLVKTKGRSPRIRLASLSMISSLAPTSGARSILLMTRGVGGGGPRPPFCRGFFAGGDVDDIDRQIGQLGREGRGKVVASRLDQDQIEIREYPAHFRDRG